MAFTQGFRCKNFYERLELKMKRKFLAKAITLGLMLAVPFGVEAANVNT